jgi:hypothetical protein
MPDNAPPSPLCPFDPMVMRTVPEERKLLADWMERVLAAHPAWPWLLIEEEARRRAEEALAAPRRYPGSPTGETAGASKTAPGA